MKLFIFFAASIGLLAQSYGTYVNPTNGAPVAHTSWLRSGLANSNVLGDPTFILYMPMSSPADKAYDYSGNSLTSSISGGNPATTQSPFLHFLGCGAGFCPQLGNRGPYFFNSSLNKIVTPSITLPSTFTFNVWVAFNGAPVSGYQRILETLYSNGFYLGTDTTKTHWQVIVSTSTLTNCISNATINTTFGSNWTMLTVTYSSGTVALYINGSSATMTGSCAYSAMSTPTQALTIGCAQGTGCNSGTAFSGMIQGLRLYNRVLTSAEISAIYAAETSFH